MWRAGKLRSVLKNVQIVRPGHPPLLQKLVLVTSLGAGSRLPERVGCGECAFSLCQLPSSQRHMHRVFRGTLWRNGKILGKRWEMFHLGFHSRGMAPHGRQFLFIPGMISADCPEEILMSYIWTVTGWHRHVGTVGLLAEL